MRKPKAPPPPDDKALLDAHFADLQNEGPVMSEQEERPDENEEEEPEPEEPPVAAASVRKPGRPRGSGRTAAPAGVAAPPANDWPSQAGEVWDRIVGEVLVEKGWSPEQTYCTVYRSGVGPFMGGMGGLNDRMLVGRIEGAAICGSPEQPPSQALTDFMEMVIHPQASGPARYELDFHYLRGQIIKKGYMSLPHPTEIARRRAYAGEYAARQGMGGPPPVMGPPPMPHYPQPGMGYPQYQAPYVPPPYYSQPAPPMTPQTDPAIHEMRRELAATMGAVQALNEARARDAERRGEPPPAPIVPPAAPAPPAEDPDARIVRLINATLDARGVGAIRTGVGAPPATGVAAVAEQMRTNIGALREAFSMFKELDKFRKDIGGVEEEPEVVQAPNPIVEDPNSPAFGVRPIPFTMFEGQPIMWPQDRYETDEDGNKVKVDESMLERWARFGAANPKFALAFLESASKILGQGAFGQLLQAFTRQGGAAAQAAAQVASNGAGVGKPPGSNDGGSGAPPVSGWGP